MHGGATPLPCGTWSSPDPLRAFARRESLAVESATAAPAVNTCAPAARTTREAEVLSLLAGGRTGKEIAADLGVSRSTAQRHIANIDAKIGARGRDDAAAYPLARGLVRRASPNRLHTSCHLQENLTRRKSFVFSMRQCRPADTVSG